MATYYMLACTLQCLWTVSTKLQSAAEALCHLHPKPQLSRKDDPSVLGSAASKAPLRNDTRRFEECAKGNRKQVAANPKAWKR
eukprot:1188414-Prorocentrum_minimum.AAC.3